MTKLKKRLPVLLLALVLVFMPVMLAVPASADVLSGSSIRYFNAWGSEILTPYVDDSGERFYLDEFGIPYVVVRHNFFPFCVYSDGPFTVELVDSTTLRFTFDHVDVFGSLMLLRFSSNGWSVFDEVAVGDLEYYDLSISGVTGYPKVYFYGLDMDSDPLFSEIDFLSISAGSGILSVFSGVGSWLADAVGSLSTMFWTVEGGMTVLGYLAVASLALAVILLIFYLIAGWLKFK